MTVMNYIKGERISHIIGLVTSIHEHHFTDRVILPRDRAPRLHLVFGELHMATVHGSMTVRALPGFGFHGIVYYFEKDKFNRAKIRAYFSHYNFIIP